MARSRETRLVFECGVMRFDASANLFVHLSHSVDAPHSVVIGDAEPTLAPASERRARVASSKEPGPVAGIWPEFTTALPRGLVVEVRGYKQVELGSDGKLIVLVGEHDEMPLWFEHGQEHVFRHDGEQLRMWDKSSRPEIQKGKKTVAKKSSASSKAKKADETKAAAKKAAPTPPRPDASPSSSDPATQWAGAQSSYGGEASNSYDTGSSGPLGCLSVFSSVAIGMALLLVALL